MREGTPRGPVDEGADEMFRAMVELASDAIVAIDSQQRIRVWNQAAEEMFGYSSHDMLGNPMDKLLPGDMRAGHSDLVGGFASGDRDRRRMGGPTQLLAVCKDGRQVPVDIALVKIPGPGGPVMVASVRDISETLADAREEWFDTLVSNSFEGISVLDANGTILHIQMVDGYNVDGMIGENIRDWVHPDGVQEWDEILAGVVQRGHGASAEATVRRRFPDGYRWLELRLRNMLDDPVVNGVTVNGRDVTERVEAENLRRSEKDWYEALVSNGFEGASVLGANGQILHMQTLENSYDTDHMIGRHTRDWVHPDDLQQWDDTFTDLIQRGDGATAELTVRRRFPEGYRWLEVRLRNLLDHPAINGITANGRDVTERRTFEVRLEHSATHDALTGLPDRSLLMDRADQALARSTRGGAPVAVLFMDLDGFKAINDTCGHEAGDQMLVVVAERLCAVVRDSDTVARQGGDEFVVLVEDCVDAADVLLLAERIRAAIHEPVNIAGSKFQPTLSIGIALSNDTADDAHTLLKNADAAMYQAKSAGRDRIETFGSSLRDCLRLRQQTEAALREAEAAGQLRVYYQPIVEVRSGVVKGAEALVRWQHPDRGLLTPDEFMPIAEEAGLITAIDTWVLRTACEQAAAWAQQTGARFHIGANVSTRQLMEPSLPDTISGIIEDTGINPAQICVEITEAAIIEHPTRAADRLRAIHELGVRIALDDFGTGYSSLTHLQDLPLTHIKLDTPLTAALGTNAKSTTMTRAIIGIAHELGLSVVAEGVETADQFALLRSFGCDLAQGSYLGAPRTQLQFEQRLNAPDASHRASAPHLN